MSFDVLRSTFDVRRSTFYVRRTTNAERRTPNLTPLLLSLYAPCRKAGDEVALQEHEDGNDRHQRDEAGGGEQVPVGVVAALETEQPERHGVARLRIEQH